MGDPHKRTVLKFRQNTANEQWNTNTRELQFVWDPATRQLLIAIKNQQDTITFPLSWRDSSDLAYWLRQQVNNERLTRVSIIFDDGEICSLQGTMLIYNRGWTEQDLKIFCERYLHKYHIESNAKTGFHAVAPDHIIYIDIVEDFVEDTGETVTLFDEDGNERVEMA